MLTAFSPAPGPWGGMWLLLTCLRARGMVGSLPRGGDWAGPAQSWCGRAEASLGRTSGGCGEAKDHSHLLTCSGPLHMRHCHHARGSPPGSPCSLKPQGPGQSRAEAALGEEVKLTEAGQATTPTPA